MKRIKLLFLRFLLQLLTAGLGEWCLTIILQLYICSPNCNLPKKWRSPSVLGRIFHSMLMHCLRVQSYLSFLLFLFACLQFVWFLLFILFFSQYFTINSFFSKLPDEQIFHTLTSLQKQARPLIGVRPYIERTLVKLGVYLMKTS